VDCDWFSNDELLPIPTFPDRSDRSGGYVRHGRGRRNAGVRGGVGRGTPPSAAHGSIFSLRDGGNLRHGMPGVAESGRGAWSGSGSAGDGLSPGGSQGRDAIRPGGRGWRRSLGFQAQRHGSIQATPGSGDPGPLRPVSGHFFRLIERPGLAIRGDRGSPGLFLGGWRSRGGRAGVLHRGATSVVSAG
jgi:hypothetical protein